MASLDNVTVILAHGAWADGSSWSEVICRLTGTGPNRPLRATGGDYRSARVHGFACSEMDDRLLAPHGWRRD
ncbi:MAG TPA: hypothetical protein VFB14_13805 [Bryobacteraceae bacterium]|nr:hypothetical protein [Bryobacteraceae bacterium]